MKLLEHFAGHALSGILANSRIMDTLTERARDFVFEISRDPEFIEDVAYEMAACRAFEVAQAMVAELQRREAAVGV